MSKKPNTREDAQAAFKAGDFTKAEKILQQLLKTNPDDPVNLNALGSIQFMQGRVVESEDNFRRAVGIASNFVEARGNLGLAAQHLGKHDEALSLLQNAVQTGGATARILQALGAELIRQSQPDRARAVLAKWVEAQPDNALALSYLGMATGDCGRHAEAEALWEQARKKDQAIVEPDAFSARLRQGTGDIAGAVAAMEKALAMAPAHAATLFSWAFVADGNAAAKLSRDQVLAAIEDALKDDSIAHEDRYQLGFAAGKLLESNKDYERAAERYVEANRQVWLRHAVDSEVFQAWHDQLLSMFNPDFFHNQSAIIAREPDGYDRCGEDLIFIVGMPRSGTTLVEQIISREPSVAPGGERPDMDMIAGTFMGKMKDNKSEPLCGTLPGSTTRM